MKTTLHFLTILLISVSAAVYSQQYHPLLGNPSWIAVKLNVGAVSPPINQIIQPGIDVEIGTVTYKKFYDPFAGVDTDVYLREDLLQKKVFSLISGSERLIYDFSLENSDTFTQDEQTYVATVDFVTVNGEARKRINLQSIVLYNGHDLRQTWIEGVGSDSHPLRPNYNARNRFHSTHQSIFQKCAFQDGEHIYGNADCTSLLNTTDEIEANSKIGFYPNPFVSELFIQNNAGFENLSLKLYNPVGQMVLEMAQVNGQQLVLKRNNLASGLYLLQFFDKGVLLKTEKVWITD